MSNGLLKGKKGIIFGALNSQSIAWHVAEKAHEQGAQFVLTNAPIAMRMGEINELAEKTGSKIIPADATIVEDLEKLIEGIDLEDGRTNFDVAKFVKDGNPREVGVELHSGKNRIVRRMFEAMGYEVVKLDRVQFASLTKKDLPRGYFRHLTEKEVAFLKMS